MASPMRVEGLSGQEGEDSGERAGCCKPPSDMQGRGSFDLKGKGGVMSFKVRVNMAQCSIASFSPVDPMLWRSETDAM